MSDTQKPTLPGSMIQRATIARFEVDVGADFPVRWEDIPAEHRDVYRNEALAILAAALDGCEVREEFGHSRKVPGKQWHLYRCPTSDLHRLVITTPAEDVPSTEGERT